MVMGLKAVLMDMLVPVNMNLFIGQYPSAFHGEYPVGDGIEKIKFMGNDHIGNIQTA